MHDLLKITSKGFQFLLEDRSAQVWQILMYYIKQGMVSFSTWPSDLGGSGVSLVGAYSVLECGSVRRRKEEQGWMG